LFGDVGDETRLPEREARAADTVARVVSGQAEPGAVEPVADLTALGLTLGLELAGDLPRQGRFGTGVLVAPLGSAIGLDADVVFVVGLAEELVPGQAREDKRAPMIWALAPFR
jgi:ATP-dependent helicase/nuclease subunit B